MLPSAADRDLDDLIIEVRQGLRAVRSLRAIMLELAYKLIRNPGKNSCLLLIDSGISAQGLEREICRMHEVLQSDVSERLGLVSYRNGKLDTILGPHLQRHLDQLQNIAFERVTSPRNLIRLPRPDYTGEILRLMILLWLTTGDKVADVISSDPLPYATDKPPVRNRQGFSIKYIQESIGASYRTVIRGLETPGPALTRYSDRSVALTAFPRTAWKKFVVLAETSRHTKYFADRSGQPRSPQSLMQRLKKLNCRNTAIGGVAGSLRIYSDLDLVGLPRLDLHVHNPGPETDISFIGKLDPALKETDPDNEKPSLAVHFLRRKRSYFRIDEDQRLWADPVECLLDLYAMRMIDQALQFHDALSQKDE